MIKASEEEILLSSISPSISTSTNDTVTIENVNTSQTSSKYTSSLKGRIPLDPSIRTTLHHRNISSHPLETNYDSDGSGSKRATTATATATVSNHPRFNKSGVEGHTTNASVSNRPRSFSCNIRQFLP